jgi:hypothetical protein
MKPQNAAYFLVGMVLLLLPACTLSQPEDAVSQTSTATAIKPSKTANAATSDAERLRPDTRIIPTRIEGKMTEVELKLFKQKALPFTTYVPAKDFSNEVGSSDEGTGVRFYYSPKGVKDENAYIHIFTPAQSTSAEAVQNLILGDRGLLATNGWELVDRTTIVSYPWVREKLLYQQRTADKTFVGAIYIGEHKGKAFYAFTHYPESYSDEFEPESTLVLENLQFKDQD